MDKQDISAENFDKESTIDQNQKIGAEDVRHGAGKNKIAVVPMKRLIWQMGLPMVISMILQAVYNIVDTIFVINMGADGVYGNLALTYAFPIQLLMIAIGVGTGIGINALLSRSLGEKDTEKVNKTVGNGIFIALCVYVLFLLFGILGAKWFISLQADGNATVIKMGTQYLQICCILSLGSIGYSIFERFLQATGKTNLSTIAQISGAASNIILDAVFIYGFHLGVAGAAWATVAGQFISLFLAMIFHYSQNKEVGKSLKYVKPDLKIIKGIYQVGFSAVLMQGLLSVMMFGVNMILGLASKDVTILQGSFGIYYKIMQFALFAFFGISNTIITILSFNYGMGDKARVKSCVKWGIIDTIIVAVVVTILFQCLASPLAKLFGMTASEGGGSQIQNAVVHAIRIASLGYVFMAFNVAVQGVLQAWSYALRPLLISLLRLVVFVLPITYLFTLSASAVETVWWAFVIVEILTSLASAGLLYFSYRSKMKALSERESSTASSTSQNLIITISREHGSNGKYIAAEVAKKLGLDYYDKEIVSEVAKKTGLADEYLTKTSDSVDSFNSIYLTTAPNQNAIIQQAKVIKEIADKGNCVIVGRGADFILRDYPNCLKIFIYASEDYKIKTIMKLYNDDREKARKNMLRSDKARSVYYNFISGLTWGEKSNYDLCVDSSNGTEIASQLIVDFVQKNLSQK